MTGIAAPRLAPRAPLAVVCYDRRELAALATLIGAAGDGETLLRPPFAIFRGALEGRPVALLRLPFGNRPGLLAKVVDAFLARESPALLVSLGTCLTLSAESCGRRTPGTPPDSASAATAELPIGAALIAAAARFGKRRLELPRAWVDFAGRALPRRIVRRVGETLTVDRFVDGAEAVARLKIRACGACGAEMEDFHVAQVAAARGVDLLSVRIATDAGDLARHLRELPRAARKLAGLLRALVRRLRMETYLSEGPAPDPQPLPWRITVRTPGRELRIPEAVRLARRAVEEFDIKQKLPEDGRLDVTLLSGRLAVALDGSGAGRSAARIPDLRDGIHIQGLNSISAEPEEGLLAAATVEEALAAGLPTAPADRAAIWVYRTANADTADYFEPPYPVPTRRRDAAKAGKFLVATGLGPAVDPAAEGGRDADLLISGDEMGGRLLAILDDLGGRRFTAGDLFRHRGTAARIGDDTVALSRLDRRHLLTPAGMAALDMRPGTLRLIYSADYDRFLHDYFGRRRGAADRPSLLLFTSRGCGRRCGICCSGGHLPYTALSAGQVVDLLKAARTAVGARRRLPVFVCDSYFNQDPDRIIRLADRLQAEGLGATFEFHVRHNGLEAFLDRAAPAGARPAVRGDLVDAFRRLRIKEVVLGIDAYTERSIRVLKTDVRRLSRDGERTPPPYRFEEIRAVLAALDAAGLKSRGFLLTGNPFVDDRDRLETFRNLLTLALETPTFRVDLGPGGAPHALHPFPGAPLTAEAARRGFAVVGDRYRLETPLAELEALLPWAAFGSRRETKTGLRRFLEKIASGRRRVLARLDKLRPAAGDGAALADEWRAFFGTVARRSRRGRA